MCIIDDFAELGRKAGFHIRIKCAVNITVTLKRRPPHYRGTVYTAQGNTVLEAFTKVIKKYDFDNEHDRLYAMMILEKYG